MTAWTDHAFAVLLVIALPSYAAASYRSFVERARAGGEPVRIREYWKTIALQWGLVGLLAVVWWANDRSFVVAFPDRRVALVGAAVCALVLLALGAQWVGITRLSHEQREPLRRQMATVADLLPRTARGHRVFQGLAITAGICEEILFRGFLLWYLTPVVGVTAAVVLGAVAFGFGHAYQGKAGVIKTTVVGLFAGGLATLGGTLLWPMILHAAIDLQGGAVGYLLLKDEPRSLDE